MLILVAKTQAIGLIRSLSIRRKGEEHPIQEVIGIYWSNRHVSMQEVWIARC